MSPPPPGLASHWQGGLLLLSIAIAACTGPERQDPDILVVGHMRINGLEGGFTGELTDDAIFGRGLAAPGDLDGDGIGDLAVGAPGYRNDEGVVWLLHPNSGGHVRHQVRIGPEQLGADGPPARSAFGESIAALGDLDGDGIGEIAVGASRDGVDGFRPGGVWILFLHPDGSVRRSQKITGGVGGLEASVHDGDFFGVSLAALGDLDGDGVPDLAIGARRDDGGGSGLGGAGEDTGAVWIVFLTREGRVRSHQKISAVDGGFEGVLAAGDEFGQSLASVGDLDGDGTPDLAVGAFRDDAGGTNRGAVWILFLQPDGRVKAFSKISELDGEFDGQLDDNGLFGSGVALLGDLDCDGHRELGVGQRRFRGGGAERGAFWILSLRGDGTVARALQVYDGAAGFTGQLAPGGEFGYVLASPGDLNGDGMTDLAVGQIFDDAGGANRGSVWILFLRTIEPACHAG